MTQQQQQLLLLGELLVLELFDRVETEEVSKTIQQLGGLVWFGLVCCVVCSEFCFFRKFVSVVLFLVW